MRVTPQRAHVWRVLAESGAHLSAEVIWERAKGVLPGMELSTVYRCHPVRTLPGAGVARLPRHDGSMPETITGQLQTGKADGPTDEILGDADLLAAHDLELPHGFVIDHH